MTTETIREKNARLKYQKNLSLKLKRKDRIKKAKAKLALKGEIRTINGSKTLILPYIEPGFKPKKKNWNAKLIKSHKKRL